MAVHESCSIHPAAIISPQAELAADVQVGPFAVIEGAVRIGSGCVIHSRAHLIGPLVMGSNNHVYMNTILGGRPQHMKYKDEPTSTEIGDGNTFRENVTVHRGTIHSWKTRIGNDNYLMAGAHVGHDVQIGNRCIFVNNALMGGHCIIADNVNIAGGAGIAQFCRMGRLSFLSAISCSTKDIPPFIIQQDWNIVVGVNVVGMRRAGMSAEQINAIRRVYHIVFLQGLSMPNALSRVEEELGGIDVVQEFVAFCRQSKCGINRTSHSRFSAAA